MPENICEKCFRVCKGYSGKKIHQAKKPNCDKEDEEEEQYVSWCSLWCPVDAHVTLFYFLVE